MRLGLFTAILWIAAAVWPVEVRAQAIRLDVARAPLEEVLISFRAQSAVDLVFAHRLVEGRTSSCRYDGADPMAALRCILEETGLRAERVRPRQYVLVPRVPEQAPSARRGMLAGFVMDADTGELLPGAHVYLPELRVGTVTNTAGYFALADLPYRRYDVRVSYLGYQPFTTSLLADTSSSTIRLLPAAVEAGTVVVESNRDERADLATVPGVVTVPISQLEKLPSFAGEHDLLQALQWVSGVHKVGEINGGLVVRGGEPDQNLFLLDGAPVYHPWHAFSLISTFQIETLRDIKLYRGAFPAEHGGRLASVLEANLRDGSRVRPRAVAALSLLSGRFLIETPVTSNSSFMLSGRRSYLDKLVGREHPVEGADGQRDTLRTGYYFYDMSAKYMVRRGTRHRFTASFYEGGDDLDLRLPFDLSLDISSWLRPADLFFEINQRWKNQLFSFRYQYLYSRSLFLSMTAYRSGYRAFEGALLQPTSSAGLASEYQVRLEDYGVRLDVDYYHAVDHQFQAGIQFVDRRFRSDLDAMVWRSEEAVDTLAQHSRSVAAEVVLYAQDTWQPGPRWRVQPGVRASFFGDGRLVRVDPSLNLQYTLWPERVMLRAGAGTQVQYLQRLRDRYSFLYDLVSSRWIPAGADLSPSTSVQVTAGVEAQPTGWLSLDAEAYLRVTSDILLPRDEFRTKDGLFGPGIEVGTLLGQYTVGEGRAYGIELSAHAQRGAWQAWAGYTGGRSLNRAPELGETTYRPARFDVPRSFRGVVQYATGPWDFTLSTELRSGYPHSVPVARYALGDPLGDPQAGDPPLYLYRPRINNGRLPPYFRLDVAVARRFEWLGAQWKGQVHVYNVTNRRNVISRQYDPTPEQVATTDRRGLPIVPLFELEMEL